MKKLNLFNELSISENDREFCDKELEEINWNANIFDITYKELLKVLKNKCDDNTISSLEDAKKVLYSFCKEQIVSMIVNDEDFSEANLTDDEAFAASFFGVI